MLIETLTTEELEFMTDFYNPVCLAESAFSDFDNMIRFEDEFADVRLYQLPMMSYEYLIETENPSLSRKENFKLKEGAGNVYAFGSRRHGKTMIVEQVDVLVSMMLLDGEHVGFTSIDALHIRSIVEKIVTVLKVHPLFALLNAQINRSPNYRISLPNGYLFETINMNIAGQQPGLGFMQKHMHRLYIEEAGYETEEVYNKRIDAISEEGCVYRMAGMTNFTRYSPAGNTFYQGNQAQLVNLPQFVNSKWDEGEKKKMIKEYSGEQSVGYKIFVNGEVTDEGIAVFDMSRVRTQYLEDKVLKVFEINKDSFRHFREMLILERPANVKRCFVCADIGETAPTEVIIIFQINDSYYYAYEIIAYRLDDKQQFYLLRHIIDAVNADVISLDTTDGTGRAIFRQLAEMYPAENMVACAFTEKVDVGLEKDERGRVVFDGGKPKMKSEYVSEWSVKRLKTLFYEGKLFVPKDHKLDLQLNSVVSNQTINRVTYEVAGGEDHLFSAFRVFAVAEWAKEFAILNSIKSKVVDKFGC
jgi:hypothetical protein